MPRISKTLLAYALLFGLASVIVQTGSAGADPTITAAQWNAFAGGNAINTCFPGFVVSFEDVNAVPAAPPVQIAHADYERLSLGSGLATPMATVILGPDPSMKPGTLTAELDGTFVSFVVAAPGETARGFVAAGDAKPALDAGPKDDAASLTARLASALALVPKDSPVATCGLTRVTFVDKKSPDTGASIQLILRDGKIVGGIETRL
jgi:hypothetical protein